MKLAHLQLPGLTRYAYASELQQHLVTTFLSFKSSPTTLTRPVPTIITASFRPVYTCGRREVNTVSQEHQIYLRNQGQAEFYETMRGGQTTFHGPGQLVAYPIIDLKQYNMSPRNYISLLEDCLISTCARYGIKGFTTKNPGVWTSLDHKIAAVGVHLRRNITSHGIGLNISTDLKWFDRIVACGLEGKYATSFEKQGVLNTSVEEVASTFVGEFGRQIDAQPYEISQQDILLLERGMQSSCESYNRE